MFKNQAKFQQQEEAGELSAGCLAEVETVCRPGRKHAPAGMARERVQTSGFYFGLRHEPLC